MTELWAQEIKKGKYKQKLNVEVDAGDYEAWISPYGNYVAYLVLHELVTENNEEIYKKIHRTIFRLSDGVKVSEENLSAPALLPAVPSGQSIPADPMAFLFSSYKKNIFDPPPPTGAPTRCERIYWGKPFHVWYANKKVTYISPNQRIAPPNTPTGTPQQEETRKFENWIKQNDCKGDLKAKWQEWTVTDKNDENNEPICEDGTKKDNLIELNKLGIADDEVEFTTVVTIGIYRK